jgi:peroxiredoxin Q/BCP
MQGFVEAQDAFTEHNAQIVGISVDPWPAANAFAESLGATFPLLGDWPLNRASHAYDVYNDERYISNRVTFVIDENRVIRAVIDEPRDMEKHSTEALAAIRSIAKA